MNTIDDAKQTEIAANMRERERQSRKDLNDAFERLSKSALKVKAQRDSLLEAAKAVWKLLEDGQLVRQTNRDHEPDWAIKQIPVVRSLSALEQAIAKCEE